MKFIIRNTGGCYREAIANVRAQDEDGRWGSIVERVNAANGPELEKRLRSRFPHAKAEIARLNLKAD